MIVCHCNRLTSADVAWTVHEMGAREPDVAVTPFRVFKACGHRPNCGNCIPLIARLIGEDRPHPEDQEAF